MRNSSRLVLVGCFLLFLFGLGWCWQHSEEVHDWSRFVGRKPPPAADEVVLRQRTSAVLPWLDGAVKIRIGDIKEGKTADVEIIGPESVTLASKMATQVGDRIPFNYDNKTYEVEVIRYVDKIGTGDTATFRVIVSAKDGLPEAFTYSLKENGPIRGRSQNVNCLAFADDGKTLWSKRNAVMGKSDIGWYDVATGEERQIDKNAKPPELREPKPGQVVEAVSNDGRYAASIEKPGNVTLVDLKTKKTLASLKHFDPAQTLAFSPDGTKLAVGTSLAQLHSVCRGKITLWDVPSGKKISSTPWVGPVWALAFSPDGTVLASGHFLGDIKRWELVKKATVPPDPQVKDGPSSIEGTWKVEGHQNPWGVQQCVIGKIDGTQHNMFVKSSGFEAPKSVFVLNYDPAESRKIVSPYLEDYIGVYSATGDEVTIRFPDSMLSLTRIIEGLDAEMQAETKHMRNTAASAEGKVALEGLKNRKRNVHSSMVAGGGPFAIDFPTGAKIENADVKDIATIHGIDSLRLAKTQLTDDDLTFVASFTRLARLDVGHTAITDAGLKHLNSLKRLGFLNLGYTRITDAGLKAMADLPSLTSLNLSGCDQVTQTGIAAIFHALPQLPGIGFAGGYQRRDASRPLLPLRPGKPGSARWNKALATARQAVNVDIALGFEYPDVLSDSDIEHLKDFAGLKASVIALDLYEATKLTDAGFKHLAVLSALELLSMEHVNMGETGMQVIARLPKVKHLSLRNCKVSDEGMKHLAGMPQLESVNLAGAMITDKGIKNLVGSNLRRVQAGSPQQQDTIRNLLPKLEAWRFPDQYRFHADQHFE